MKNRKNGQKSTNSHWCTQNTDDLKKSIICFLALLVLFVTLMVAAQFFWMKETNDFRSNNKDLHEHTNFEKKTVIVFVSFGWFYVVFSSLLRVSCLHVRYFIFWFSKIAVLSHIHYSENDWSYTMLNACTIQNSSKNFFYFHCFVTHVVVNFQVFIRSLGK